MGYNLKAATDINDAIIMGYDLIGATVMNYDNTDAIVIHIAL